MICCYKRIWCFALFCVCNMLTFNVSAVTVTYYPHWHPNGGVAGVCTFSYPTLQPLSQPKVLVVDNHLPNGTVLYSWSYADFAPNFSGSCSANGATTNNSSDINFRMFFDSLDLSSGYMPTNNPGIGIKVYFTYHWKGSCSGCLNSNSTTVDGTSSGPSLSTEYGLPTDGVTYLGARFSSVWENVAPYYRYYSPTANTFGMSLRAELIKIGAVNYSAPLAPTGNSIRLFPMMTPGQSAIAIGNNVLGSGGITLIPPACRLSSPTDYNINMGRWVNSGPGSLLPGSSLPAYGSIRPVDLNLECSGQVNGVQFRFEDAGSSPSSNKNISLYDSAGGNKIEGLEIEMRYGGSRVAVDNITKTDTGSKGAIKTNPQDLSFNSQDTATFGARFVQTAPIKKSGAIYTGPVTGKVNMYVTYH